ncbi:hypothetical protein J1605_001476 [Eschrichtius robustus]|uniref:Uncharacterized protein n=1 Tax=Eschrichtius robustus TaxID=9764 RepID=A0AB34I5N9_ESCRO|nr:hypothetical protein J1605_001476 [Eschrichtius robustus]
MGRRSLLLLLLAFLTPGAATPVPPALRALSSLHLSTSFRSRPAVAMKYSIHYIQQKVRGKGFGMAERVARTGFVVPRHRSSPEISDP